MNEIKKDAVFICSTGRTGTQFFGKMLSSKIEDCYSIHEPGALWLSRPYEWGKKRKRFGFFKMSIGQFMPKHSMFKLSADRATGRIGDEKARRYVYYQRKEFVESIDESLYVESNAHLFGVLDLIDEIFTNCNFIYIVRDPRTWLRSALNTKEYVLYSLIDWRVFKASLRAFDYPDDPYYNRWKQMSKFERFAWYYNKVNSFVFDKMPGRKNFRVFKYEELFKSSTREKNFREMLDFAITFNHDKQYDFRIKEQTLDKKVHSGSKKGQLPHWRDWSNEMAGIVEEHCGQWMEKFGYGQEEEWQRKL